MGFIFIVIGSCRNFYRELSIRFVVVKCYLTDIKCGIFCIDLLWFASAISRYVIGIHIFVI